MADNVVLNAGSGGATMATDDISSVHYQIVKIAHGADGAVDGLVDNASPMPVSAVQSGAWTVAANAGTNLNTSALALESGGNLDTLVATDFMLGTDFSTVFGAASLVLATQADDVANTSDGIQTTAFGYVFDGTTWDRLRGDSANGVLVNLGSNNDVSATIAADSVGLALENGGVLDDISGFLATLAGTVATEVQVDVVSSGLPTGASTAAKQDTIIGHVDGIEGLLGTIDADTGAISTQTLPAQSFYRNIDANAEAAIKAGAGVLHWVHVMNMTAAVAYLHLYDDTTGNVNPGTTVPDLTFPIPTSGDTNGAGFNLPLGPNGQAFANAITLVVTTTIDGSAGDPGTNGVFVNAGYT